MGDDSEYCFRRKKRPYFRGESNFEYSQEKMKSPIINTHPNKGLDYKSNYSGKFYDAGYQSWEKRGSGRHFSEWDKRGYYSNKACYYDGNKDMQEDDAKLGKGLELPVKTPMILSRGRSDHSQGELQKDDDSISRQQSPLPDAVEQIMKKEKETSEISTPKAYHIASKLTTVEVVGMQGTGKSTIASLLANPSFDASRTRTYKFRPEEMKQILNGLHSTSGIEVFVTPERAIILDCQPLLSPSVMERIITQERKFFSDFSSTENLMEIESLQLLTFAMSVAHVLVVVEDYAVDPNILRLLQTCEMMKPLSSSSSRHSADDFQQYFPHLVFIHNRAKSFHMKPEFLKKLQTLYYRSFLDSYLIKESDVGTASGVFSPCINTNSCGGLCNVFLIPEFQETKPDDANFHTTLDRVRYQILGLRRNPMTHVTLTEKSWYNYAYRMWENIHKSNLYVEYSRLLP